MSQDWSQHGHYRLHWQGNVLQVRYEGVWNEVAVQHLHRDVKAFWSSPGAPRPWAMLSDLRLWDGATPASLELWWQFFEDAVAHGLTAVTDIMPSHFHALLVRSTSERASQLARYRNSADPEQGLAWLVELGFDPGPAAEH